MSIKVTGGNKLKAIAKDVRKFGKQSYDIGFFPKAKYEDGTTVADVAAWNEFGTRDIPERPFFRSANKDAAKTLPKLVNRLRDPESKMLTVADVSKVALVHVGIVQTSIVQLREPVNDPGTVKIKGSTNPLVDTGLMKNSVTFEVE